SDHLSRSSCSARSSSMLAFSIGSRGKRFKILLRFGYFFAVYAISMRVFSHFFLERRMDIAYVLLETLLTPFAPACRNAFAISP
ncbi:MAG: hypothetical protein ACRCV9_01900, partial [Burkholderiaceae bacterium]